MKSIINILIQFILSITIIILAFFSPNTYFYIAGSILASIYIYGWLTLALKSLISTIFTALFLGSIFCLIFNLNFLIFDICFIGLALLSTLNFLFCIVYYTKIHKGK